MSFELSFLVRAPRKICVSAFAWTLVNLLQQLSTDAGESEGMYFPVSMHGKKNVLFDIISAPAWVTLLH
jgi:hypothetical protein